jgi:DNA-binding transcriptional MerR regulator
VHENKLTLEELAAATGMTARNVRAYQTRGLIPSPSRSGRRSVYGVVHLQRLQAIERARRQGASLSLIAAHLAAGRSLDDGTLIDWTTTGTAIRDPTTQPERTTCTDVAPLVTHLDIQRDLATQTDIEELVAAGVFRPESGLVYTGRELASTLTELQRLGLPLQVTLGIAQRTLRAAGPIVAAVHAATAGCEWSMAVQGQLGTVACLVLRHLIAEPHPDDAELARPAPEPGTATTP